MENAIKKVLRKFYLGINKTHWLLSINIWETWKYIFLFAFILLSTPSISFLSVPLFHVVKYSIFLMQKGNYIFLGCSEKWDFRQKISTRIKEEEGSSTEYTYFFNKQLGPGLIPQSCLYFQRYLGLKVAQWLLSSLTK